MIGFLGTIAKYALGSLFGGSSGGPRPTFAIDKYSKFKAGNQDASDAELWKQIQMDLTGGSNEDRQARDLAVKDQFDTSYGQARGQLMRRGVYNSGVHGDWASKIARGSAETGIKMDAARRSRGLGMLEGYDRTMRGQQSRNFGAELDRQKLAAQQYRAQVDRYGRQQNEMGSVWNEARDMFGRTVNPKTLVGKAFGGSIF